MCQLKGTIIAGTVRIRGFSRFSLDLRGGSPLPTRFVRNFLFLNFCPNLGASVKGVGLELTIGHLLKYNPFRQRNMMGAANAGAC